LGVIEHLRCMSWKEVSRLAAGALLALGVVHRFISSLFYSRFGVTPEEVGVGYTESLIEAAVGTFLVVIALNAFALVVLGTLMFLAAVRTVSSAEQIWKQTEGRRGQLPLYIAHRLAVVAVFVVAVWWSEESGRWLPVVGGAVVAAVLFELSPPSPFLADPAEHGALPTTSGREGEPDAMQRRVRRVFRVSMVLIIILAAGILVQQGITAERAAAAAQKGIGAEGFPFSAWRAQRATVSWLVAPPPSLAGVQEPCVMYLGQADNVVVLYHVDARATLRVPLSNVTVSTRAPVDDRTPCRSGP
jgi:hypothetical protein